MSELEALLLGIVQGLTEYLPISSSGHLILVPWLQDETYLRDDPSFAKTFDVALHLGTLVAVLWYFRHDLARIAAAFLRTLRTRTVESVDERLAWAVVVGTVPVVIAGGLGAGVVEEELGQPWLISVMLIVFGLVLYHADRRAIRRGLDGVGIRHGLIAGLAQILSLVPGVSRSGITITTARYLGFDRDAAARLSFLLLVPATGAAVVYKAAEAAAEGLPDGAAGPLAVGAVAALVSGYIAIGSLLALVRRHTYDGFVVYRILAGVFCLSLIALEVRPATL